ncbi:hypothetical protein A3843_15480 [Pseudovibrio exalbescens]|uniref:Uncharacterized protein n=1 Tax=Pseudovibrio exalbescens TaxID=197461 RepID=A0A1U7JEK0_9HYPH|nr:hypothetical protein A3843_15480 [Pseudovibrio exalbescens]
MVKYPLVSQLLYANCVKTMMGYCVVLMKLQLNVPFIMCERLWHFQQNLWKLFSKKQGVRLNCPYQGAMVLLDRTMIGPLADNTVMGCEPPRRAHKS